MSRESALRFRDEDMRRNEALAAGVSEAARGPESKRRGLAPPSNPPEAVM